MSTQIVRNSLLKSSISIKSIRDSVGSFSVGFMRAQNTSSEIVQETNEINNFKRSLISKDDSYFRKRQENIKRKQREDEIESSTVGGAIKKQGSITSTSTRGFLGRILDFLGVVLVGWIVTTLPRFNKSVGSFITRIKTTVGVLNRFIENVSNNLLGFRNNLEKSQEQLQTIKLDEDEKELRSGFEETEDAFRNMNRTLFQQFNLFNDPKSIGVQKNSWDEIENMPLSNLKSFFNSILSAAGISLPDDISEDDDMENINPKPTLDRETGDIDERTPSKQNRDEVVSGTTIDNTTDTTNDKGSDVRVDEEKELKQSNFEMFMKGTSKVKNDGLAYLHKDEAVIPAESVKTYGVDFIEKIIANKEQDNSTKIKTANQLLEKLSAQYKEENMGVITTDQYDKIKEETVGRLKRELKKADISNILNVPDSILRKKELVANKITSGRKKPTLMILGNTSSQSKSQSSPQITPSSPSRSSSSSGINISKSTRSLTNKLQDLELAYC